MSFVGWLWTYDVDLIELISDSYKTFFAAVYFTTNTSEAVSGVSSSQPVGAVNSCHLLHHFTSRDVEG
jgi:hypothetical protein